MLFSGLFSTLFVLLGGAAIADEVSHPRELTLEDKPYFGDLNELIERRAIRVLLPYSRTLFFIEKGQERGITAEVAREFERFVNRRFAKEIGKRPITVYLVPTTRDKLLTGVAEGRGDIAAGNITITQRREGLVRFAPVSPNTVNEIVIAGPSARPLSSLEDLSGRTVHVRPSTSYAESLSALSAKFISEGRKEIQIVPLSEEIEDEDKLEMLSADLIEYSVVDDWLVGIWKDVLPKLKAYDNLVLRDGGRTGWAVRTENTALQQLLQEFFEQHLKRSASFAYRVTSFHKQLKRVENNTSNWEHKRFTETIDIFKRYGERYRFDPLMLAAQGYQESRLRQEARSPVGAIGVMQVMPATGRELSVGDITALEPNIHAGVKYMDRLMSVYFADAAFTDAERPLFAFASYNAGPNRIARLRKLAGERNLDPNRWFNNVEIIVAEKIGMETTTYVRNIFKYYIAYKLTQDADTKRRAAVENALSTTP
jgi:membrane-bound lytic murein transglycosylase MltF